MLAASKKDQRIIRVPREHGSDANSHLPFVDIPEGANDMNDFIVKEPLILFEIGKAMSEGRHFKDAVEGWWKTDPDRAANFHLVLGKRSGKIVGAFRPKPGSWEQRPDGRWGFESDYAMDVWTEYVRKDVPIEYRSRAPFQYLSP